MSPAQTRRQLLNVALSRAIGAELGACSWTELEVAASTTDHPLTATWPESQRERLRAILQLCGLYVRAQPLPSLFVRASDVVRHFEGRCRSLSERAVWLLALDDHHAFLAEALLVYGGSTMIVPPLRSLLRQALQKAAPRLYVVDYRPLEFVEVDPRTLEAFQNLVALGSVLDLVVEDWLVLGPNGVESVRQHGEAADTATVAA